jgi:hypothetical protein
MWDIHTAAPKKIHFIYLGNKHIYCIFKMFFPHKKAAYFLILSHFLVRVPFKFYLNRALKADPHIAWSAHALLCHAVLLKATAHRGRRETACGRHARYRLLPATTRSSTKAVISCIPLSDAGGQCETK